MLKALHVLFAVSLFGLMATEYFYLILASRHSRLFQQSLRFSLFIDVIILFLFVGLFLSGSFLVAPSHFTMQTPWIQAVYTLLTLSLVCWSVVVMVKWKNYRLGGPFRWRWVFHGCYGLIALFLLAIIHDAVMKSTYLFG